MHRLTWDRIAAAVASRPPTRVSEAVAARAAVALILREAAAGIEILFIRRAEHPQDPWSGQMAFPGGRAEPAEEDLKATAIRETAEEIGLDLQRDAECLGILDEVRAMARMRPMSLTILPFVFRLRGPVEPRLGSEVRSLHWIPLDDLLAAERRSVMDYVDQGETLQFPCLRVGVRGAEEPGPCPAPQAPRQSLAAEGRQRVNEMTEDLVIWGLTYRMFVSFQERIPPAGPALPPASPAGLSG